MKALLFHKFKAYVERKYLGLGIQIISLFLYKETLGGIAIQSYEHHICSPTAM